MSRVGRLPVKLPAGVEVKIDEHLVEVKGPKGKLTREIHPEMQIAQEDNILYITRPSDEKQHRALHGLTRSLVQNMVDGVEKGFSKSLNLVGVGYRAALQGKKLVLNVGYSHQVEIEPDEGLEIEVPETCANSLCPLANSTLNMALGSVSTTVPSTSITFGFELGMSFIYPLVSDSRSSINCLNSVMTLRTSLFPGFFPASHFWTMSPATAGYTFKCLIFFCFGLSILRFSPSTK
jgi:large subunit ribosomal protein L6